MTCSHVDANQLGEKKFKYVMLKCFKLKKKKRKKDEHPVPKHRYTYASIIKSFEFWTQRKEGHGFLSAWQLELLRKALYLDGLKTASFSLENLGFLSVCVCA